MARFSTAGEESLRKTSRPLPFRARPIDVPIRPVPTILIGPVSLEFVTGPDPSAGLWHHEDIHAGFHSLECPALRLLEL